MNAITAKSRPKWGNYPTVSVHFRNKKQEKQMKIPLEYGRRRPSQISAVTNSERIAKRLHSKAEVARAVSVSPRTLENWMAQKRIPFIRLSARLIRFDLERVKAALDRYEVKEVGRRQ